jgi:soluble lytic murein transglycosylase-like protein
MILGSIAAIGLSLPLYAKDETHLRALADKAARQYGIDEDIFKSLVEHESNWKVNAQSNRGALGLTQILPATAKAECGISRTQLLNPEQNLLCGAQYLSKQIKKFGSVKAALCAYNAGPAAISKKGRCPNYRVTQKYVEKILSSREDALLRMSGL